MTPVRGVNERRWGRHVTLGGPGHSRCHRRRRCDDPASSQQAGLTGRPRGTGQAAPERPHRLQSGHGAPGRVFRGRDWCHLGPCYELWISNAGEFCFLTNSGPQL